MRKLNLIIYHCSATREGQTVTVEDLRDMHLERGFNDIGYHFVIGIDGTIHKGRDISKPGAHAKGYNDNSVGICYVGGLDKKGKPSDTRTWEQITAMRTLDQVLRIVYPEIERSCGHRDLSVDLNGDGVISRNEWMKECPCFDFKTQF